MCHSKFHAKAITVSADGMVLVRMQEACRDRPRAITVSADGMVFDWAFGRIRLTGEFMSVYGGLAYVKGIRHNRPQMWDGPHSDSGSLH